MALNLANGQLAASSGTILGVGTNERTVAVMLFNTSAVEQTIYLRHTRSESTVQDFARVKLEQYQAAYVRGIQMDPSDVLSGYATAASAVNYIVSQVTSTEPFSVLVLDSDGTRKASADVTLTTTEKSGLTQGELVIAGLLEEVRDVLLKIA